MSKYTPGPWEFCKDGGWRLNAGGESIMGNEKYYPWVPDNESDWRLIAAAPDLLEALKGICDEQDERQGYASYEAYDKARDAIAKATGEQQ